MRRLFLVLVCCFAAGLARQPLSAQEPPGAENPAGAEPTPDPNAGDPGAEPSGGEGPLALTFWKAELPGGTFLIAHDSISAVSTQEYVLDGAARVTEVNIMTTGVFQPRFYYIEPLPAQIPLPAGQSVIDRAKSAALEAATRATQGDAVWARVVKTYPTTTHAGTIEYRLETKEQLEKLFQSLEKSWTSSRSETFSPGGSREFKPRGKGDGADQATASDAAASGAN